MLQYSLSNEGEKGKEDIKFLSRGKKQITKILKKSQVISFQSPCSICSLSIRLPDRTMNQLKTTYKLLVVTNLPATILKINKFFKYFSTSQDFWSDETDSWH